MIDVQIKFQRARLNESVVTTEAENLSDNLTKLLVAANQLALLHYGKKVSGDTLKSVMGKTIVRSKTFHHRQVVAASGYKFIRDGRKAGSKMPVRFVGTGKRGGKVFEPLPLLIRWFNTLGIPRSAWFPILRAISRRGISPVPVDTRAIQQSIPSINRYVQSTGARIARRILQK